MKLLILDLDETLVYATLNPLNEKWDFKLYEYHVYKRPGLDRFLKELKKHFEVAVWSSASDEYVNQMVKKIFPKDYKLKFIWGRSKCTFQIDRLRIDEEGCFDDQNHFNYCKKLKKVEKKGFSSLEEIIIIDDTPNKSKYNYGNVIYPHEFKGDPNDDELEQLMIFLLTIKNAENIRKIEKRGWRGTIKKK